MKLPKLLKKPGIPESLPLHAKWLAGEGAGSWFVFEQNEKETLIQRFSPEGNFECENRYILPLDLNINLDYSIDYPSHCSVVTVIQNNKKYRLEAKS